MKSRHRNLLILSLITISAAAAGGLWISISGWPPIMIRDRLYRELIEGFNQADRREKTAGKNESWEFQIQLHDNQTTALVHIPESIGVVAIKYSDEGYNRALYRYAEYTSPVEIKTRGNVLYVHWAEPLFGPKHWVLAYDVANRSEIGRRRVVSNDLH